MKNDFQFRFSINIEFIVLESSLYSFQNYGSGFKVTKIYSFVLLGSADLTRTYQQPPLANSMGPERVSKRILNYVHVKVFSIVE